MSQNVGDRKLGLSPRVIAMNYLGNIKILKTLVILVCIW